MMSYRSKRDLQSPIPQFSFLLFLISFWVNNKMVRKTQKSCDLNLFYMFSTHENEINKFYLWIAYLLQMLPIVSYRS